MMDKQKNYYVLNNKKQQLISFELNNGAAHNICEFNGVDWAPADYETKEIVEKAVNFQVIDQPAIATKITSDEQFHKFVTLKISQVLNKDDHVM